MSVEKIYWDSDCFLGHLKAGDGKAEKCDGVLRRAERGGVLTITSAFTLAEVPWMRGGPRLTGDKALVVRKFIGKTFGFTAFPGKSRSRGGIWFGITASNPKTRYTSPRLRAGVAQIS